MRLIIRAAAAAFVLLSAGISTAWANKTYLIAPDVGTGLNGTYFKQWQQRDVNWLFSCQGQAAASLPTCNLVASQRVNFVATPVSFSGSFVTDDAGNILSGTLHWSGTLSLGIPGLSQSGAVITNSAQADITNGTLNLVTGELTAGSYTCTENGPAATCHYKGFNDPSGGNLDPNVHNADLLDYFSPRILGTVVDAGSSGVTPSPAPNTPIAGSNLIPAGWVNIGGLVRFFKPGEQAVASFGTRYATPTMESSGSVLPELTWRLWLHGNDLDVCQDSITCTTNPVYQVSHNVDVLLQIKAVDPLLADVDGDGLTGAEEITCHTSDESVDSDGNRVDDKTQCQQEIDFNTVDADGDGLTGAQEAACGSEPGKNDTDEDGLNDGYECNVSHTDPTDVDTDGDGLRDAYEVDASHQYYDGNDLTLANKDHPELQTGHWHAFNPNDASDGRSDYDGDGIALADELFPTDAVAVRASNWRTSHTDPNLRDTDGDSIPDDYEIFGPRNYQGQTQQDWLLMRNWPPAGQKSFDPTDPVDGSEDIDLDGAANKIEYSNGTDPYKPATVGGSNTAALAAGSGAISFGSLLFLLLMTVVRCVMMRSQRSS